jgi:hypothetical protein
MITVKLTGEQLDNLIDVLEYVGNCEYENYIEHLEEGYDGNNHIYTKVAELMNIKWVEA